MKKQMGCLSPSGLVAALLTLAVLLGFTILRGGRLFSPGPLNALAGDTPRGGVNSHAALGGQCAACHAPPWSHETMADRCLACHEEIAQQWNDRSSLHGMLAVASGLTQCYACHLEHGGPDAPVTLVNADGFPHEAVGYSLAGHQETAAGEPFSCADCHDQALSHFDPGACASCHGTLEAAFMQTHQVAFGLDCLACHDGVDRYGAGFDHSRLAFELHGKHASLSCTACHLGARSIPDLQAAPQDCFACHQEDDAHQGQFGQDCAECHTADGWAQATFDHSLAAFPLLGKHRDVDCRQCHAEGVYKGTPQDCLACHQEDDAHQGQFGQDCAECHTADGWQEVSFDHSLSAFPLLGKHRDVDCQQCHAEGVYKGTPQDCFACHREDDAHQGQFGQDCAECHTANGWEQATFDHSLAAFPLLGKHRDVDCQECHAEDVYKGTPQDCFACHQEDDAHLGQFGQDCAGCHTPDDWKKATFDHSLATFPLTGAHLQVECLECHGQGTFKGTPQACMACHEDPAFHRGLLGSECTQCHTTDGWTPARYDRPHTFPFNHGQSGPSSCRTCHPDRLSAYTCYGCHEHDSANVEREHREEGIGDFGDCVRCHPTGQKEGGDGD